MAAGAHDYQNDGLNNDEALLQALAESQAEADSLKIPRGTSGQSGQQAPAGGGGPPDGAPPDAAGEVEADVATVVAIVEDQAAAPPEAVERSGSSRRAVCAKIALHHPSILNGYGFQYTTTRAWCADHWHSSCRRFCHSCSR